MVPHQIVSLPELCLKHDSREIALVGASLETGPMSESHGHVRAAGTPTHKGHT
jgi:hypothetical protein